MGGMASPHCRVLGPLAIYPLDPVTVSHDWVEGDTARKYRSYLVLTVLCCGPSGREQWLQ